MSKQTPSQHAQKMLELLDEVVRYERIKQEILYTTDRLFREYQEKKISYFAYKKKLDEVLKNQTKKYWIEYYHSYTYSLLKKIEFMNSSIFYDVYTHKHPHFSVRTVTPKPIITKREETPVQKERLPSQSTITPEDVLVQQVPDKEEEKAKAVQKEEPSAPKKQSLFSRLFSRRGEFKERVRKTFRSKGLLEGALDKKQKLGFTVSKFEAFMNVVRRIFGIEEKEDFLAEQTSVSKHSLEIRRRAEEKEELKAELAPTLMAEEAKRIKALLQHHDELQVYQPGFFGSVANLTIKKLSIFFIDNFPDLFRYLYNALRKANIQILSNTYVNIMFLVSILSSIGAFFFLLFFLAVVGNPWYLVLVKAFVLSLVVLVLVIVLFYMYPFNKISERNKNIRANLPFAIEHMAAVAGSGVAPTKMFKLIAQAKEYGEVSVELEKIVEYIELFGYDFLTALRSVAITSPSEQLKELLDGMVSSTESGGDLRAYLQEKAKEAMLDYDLERQKYQETVSTYSDIYTGLLIAAPLFFVASLSLVSLLGGSVGNFGVDTLITFGTYLALPLLNIGFVVFLELTQPDV